MVAGAVVALVLCAASAELVINEVNINQSGGDDAEFVEILNTGPAAASLDGVALEMVNGVNGVADPIFSLAGSLAAGAYYVVGVQAVLDTLPDGVASTVANANFVQNGDPDGCRLVSGGDLVSGVSWASNPADFMDGVTEGSTANIPPEDFSLCRLPNGVSTGSNSVDFFTCVPTAGAANVGVPVDSQSPSLTAAQQTASQTAAAQTASQANGDDDDDADTASQTAAAQTASQANGDDDDDDADTASQTAAAQTASQANGDDDDDADTASQTAAAQTASQANGDDDDDADTESQTAAAQTASQANGDDDDDDADTESQTAAAQTASQANGDDDDDDADTASQTAAAQTASPTDGNGDNLAPVGTCATFEVIPNVNDACADYAASSFFLPSGKSAADVAESAAEVLASTSGLAQVGNAIPGAQECLAGNIATICKVAYPPCDTSSGFAKPQLPCNSICTNTNNVCEPVYASISPDREPINCDNVYEASETDQFPTGQSVFDGDIIVPCDDTLPDSGSNPGGDDDDDSTGGGDDDDSDDDNDGNLGGGGGNDDDGISAASLLVPSVALAALLGALAL